MGEQETLYGQHSPRTLVLIGIGCTIAGVIIGVTLIPADAMTLVQRIGLGVAMGLWGGYCVYGWRVLFWEGDDEDASP